MVCPGCHEGLADVLECALQAAFGKQSLSISGIFVYVALVTGLLGNTLSFPFALYVFICQREASTNVQASPCSFSFRNLSYSWSRIWLQHR